MICRSCNGAITGDWWAGDRRGGDQIRRDVVQRAAPPASKLAVRARPWKAQFRNNQQRRSSGSDDGQTITDKPRTTVQKLSHDLAF
jgi:hypothetical protein